MKKNAKCLSPIVITENEIIELKEKLLKYPTYRDEVIEWIEGSKEENSYSYFMFKVFIYDKVGHVAIEIEMDNKLEKPYTMTSHFYVQTEVCLINEFGKKLECLLNEDGVFIEGIQ